MGRTVINVAGVVGASGEINSAKSTIGSVKNSFSQTKNGIDSKIKCRNNIDGRLNTVQNQLSNIYRRVGKIASTVQSGAEQYRTIDERVNKERDKFAKINFIANGSGTASSVYERFFDDDFKKKTEGIVEFVNRLSFKMKINTDKAVSKISEYSEDKKSMVAALAALQLGELVMPFFGINNGDVSDILDTDDFKRYIIDVKNGKSEMSFFKAQNDVLNNAVKIDLKELENNINEFKQTAEEYIKEKNYI